MISMKNAKLSPTEAAVVQSRCEQHTGRTRRCERRQVRSMTDAAGRIQAARRVQFPQLRQACEIRPATDADARQSHDNHRCGPALSLAQHGGGTDKVVAAEIQREHAVVRPLTGLGRHLKTLAGEHRPTHAAGLPRFSAVYVGKPAVHPELEVRMGSAQCHQHGFMTAATEYGIQIRDVNLPERIQREQTVHHGFGTTGRAQCRLDRSVFVATPGTRAHHLSPHEIEHRDKV